MKNPNRIEILFRLITGRKTFVNSINSVYYAYIINSHSGNLVIKTFQKRHNSIFHGIRTKYFTSIKGLTGVLPPSKPLNMAHLVSFT